MLSIKKYYCTFHKINAIVKNNQKGDTLEVRGWINNIRKLKNNIFLDINDGSTVNNFQIVVPKNETAKLLNTGDVIKAAGQIDIAPHGHYELHAETVEIIGVNIFPNLLYLSPWFVTQFPLPREKTFDLKYSKGHLKEGFPFTPKQEHAPEYVRDYLHLRSRVNYIAAIMRLRHKAQKILHDFMDRKNFIHINTPIITTNDCEGAGEVFTVQPDNSNLLKQMSRPNVPLHHSYFDSKVYLSVSGQLHLESMSYGLGNTYTLSPAFRAENCKSTLHLSEFYMFEAELVHMENLEKLCSFIEEMLKDITNQLLNSNDVDIKSCQKKTSQERINYEWLQKPWPLITYKNAMDIILKNNDKIETSVTPGGGFSREQELFLVDHCKAPLFIIDWPSAEKPFYMRVSREDPSIVHALDLIMPTVGELCGGSLRENDEKRLIQHPNFPKDLKWYLDLRKFGGIPTGGFGMGFERYLQLLTGVKNIKDVVPFPRYPHSCKM